MGIPSVVNRNLVSNSKSRLKYLCSSSSNSWFTKNRISSPAVGLSKAQSYAPTLVANLKSDKKPMFLIQHFHNTENASSDYFYSFHPYNYSLISANNSWKDYHNLRKNPFSGTGHDKCFVAGSCNEYVLFFFHINDSQGLREALWNPTTNDIKILPESDVPGPQPGPAFIDIDSHGFGFDPQSADYKLIRFPHFQYEDDWDSYDDPAIHVELFSLKTNSWKEIAYPCRCLPDQEGSVHINGVYYWKDYWKDATPSDFILSFDFANENFSEAPHIPLPPNFDEETAESLSVYDCVVYNFVLVEFDGSLAALVHSSLPCDEEEKPLYCFSFEVWGWNGESWLQKMPRITIDHVPGGVAGVVGLFQDDKLFLQASQEGGGQLLLFDCATSTLANLGIPADPEEVHIFPLLAALFR